MPLPEELEMEFTDAYWQSHALARHELAGPAGPHAPADLLAYQELIVAGPAADGSSRRPHEDGGRASFLASVCDLLGEGEVISIGAGERSAAVDTRGSG